jgi:hypothetical protein
VSHDSWPRVGLCVSPQQFLLDWHSGLESAKFPDRDAPQLSRRKQKTTLDLAQTGLPSRGRCFPGRTQPKQTQTNPLGLTAYFSVRSVKNGQNKPIESKLRVISEIDAKNAHFLQFLNETRCDRRFRLSGKKTNPNKPIEVIPFYFSRIAQNGAKQTHGNYPKCNQEVKAKLGPDFAVFKCAACSDASVQRRRGSARHHRARPRPGSNRVRPRCFRSRPRRISFTGVLRASLGHGLQMGVVIR